MFIFICSIKLKSFPLYLLECSWLRHINQSHIQNRCKRFLPHHRGRFPACHRSQIHQVKSSGDSLRSGCTVWSTAPAWTGLETLVQKAALWRFPQTSLRDSEVWTKQSDVPESATTQKIHQPHCSCYLNSVWDRRENRRSTTPPSWCDYGKCLPPATTFSLYHVLPLSVSVSLCQPYKALFFSWSDEIWMHAR